MNFNSFNRELVIINEIKWQNIFFVLLTSCLYVGTADMSTKHDFVYNMEESLHDNSFIKSMLWILLSYL
jgi:hypothetical protein